MNEREPRCLDVVFTTDPNQFKIGVPDTCTVDDCLRTICVGGITTAKLERCSARDHGIQAAGGTVFRTE